MKYMLAICGLFLSSTAYGWYWVPPKNRINLFVGMGPTVFKTEVTNKLVTVTQKNEVIYGIGYERLVLKRLVLSTQVFNNKSGVVGLGLEF